MVRLGGNCSNARRKLSLGSEETVIRLGRNFSKARRKLQ